MIPDANNANIISPTGVLSPVFGLVDLVVSTAFELFDSFVSTVASLGAIVIVASAEPSSNRAVIV